MYDDAFRIMQSEEVGLIGRLYVTHVAKTAQAEARKAH